MMSYAFVPSVISMSAIPLASLRSEECLKLLDVLLKQYVVVMESWSYHGNDVTCMHTKCVNNNKQPQATSAYNLLTVGPLTMKFGTLIYHDKSPSKQSTSLFSYAGSSKNEMLYTYVLWWWNKQVGYDKESEAINTCYFLFGYYVPMHVHAVKKERRTVNKKFFELKRCGL